ncbi:MAG: WG repeat-containing protein [Rikenellaceae bacterium]
MPIYPTITDYLNTFESNICVKNLNITFIKDKNGRIIYFTGHNSLITKVTINNVTYALKLYTSYNKYREEYFNKLKTYITEQRISNLPKFDFIRDGVSIYVNDNFHTFPILITEWVEGETLDEVIKNLCYLGDKKKLYNLTNMFIEFSKNLVNSKHTHIDLKPSNIIVTKTGELKLIDLDALYIPGYMPEQVHEQGTAWYRHPNRKEHTYAKYLHDYPILVILVSLLTLENCPELYELHTNGENILLSPLDILRNRDSAFHAIKRYFNDTIYNTLINKLTTTDIKINHIENTIPIIQYIRLKCFDSEINDTILSYFEEYVHINEDMYGLKYCDLWGFVSKSGKIITPFMFSKINRASEDKIVLLKNNLWHIFTLNFTLISTFEAEDATYFKNELLPIKQNGEWNYIEI